MELADRFVLLLEVIDTLQKRQGHFEIIIIPVIIVSNLGIVERGFHLSYRSYELARLLCEFMLFARRVSLDLQHVFVCSLTLRQASAGYVGSLIAQRRAILH